MPRVIFLIPGVLHTHYPLPHSHTSTHGQNQAPLRALFGLSLELVGGLFEQASEIIHMLIRIGRGQRDHTSIRLNQDPTKKDCSCNLRTQLVRSPSFFGCFGVRPGETPGRGAAPRVFVKVCKLVLPFLVYHTSHCHMLLQTQKTWIPFQDSKNWNNPTLED